MYVYCSDNEKVEYPAIVADRKKKDFWYGFYCFTNKKHADRQAVINGDKIINIYELSISDNLNVRRFENADKEWLDFVIDCRKGIAHNYDIVIGPAIAQKVSEAIEQYLLGDITKETVLKTVYTSNVEDEIIDKVSFHSIRALRSIYLYDSCKTGVVGSLVQIAWNDIRNKYPNQWVSIKVLKSHPIYRENEHFEVVDEFEFIKALKNDEDYREAFSSEDCIPCSTDKKTLKFKMR